MKKVIVIFILILSSCNRDYPKQFSDAAFKDMLITQDSNKITLREVLYSNKNKKVLIDFWASWCKDCIKDFPELKKIQKQFPDVSYVFISVDRSNPSWKRAIKRYNLIGEHYNLPKGMNKGDLVDFINLGWISRYMVIDENGEISLFKATKASDESIVKALKKPL
jgi:thiol-disulfide isomerase/thioredoxin